MPEDYRTTTYRGPQEYPVPEDWLLNVVEADGISWHRYPGFDKGDRAEKVSDLPGDFLYDGEEPEIVYASLGNQHNRSSDLVTHTLRVDGEEVFSVTGLDEDVLWDSVAKALAQHARGEEVDVDPDGVAAENDTKNNASLGEF